MRKCVHCKYMKGQSGAGTRKVRLLYGKQDKERGKQVLPAEGESPSSPFTSHFLPPSHKYLGGYTTTEGIFSLENQSTIISRTEVQEILQTTASMITR